MENELSIKISASAERALKSLDRLIPKINETDNCVSKMLMHLDKNGEITGFTTELKKLDSEMDRVTKNSKNLKNALNLGTIFATASKVFRTGYSWMQNSIDYSESLNLFNVVLDKSIDKGMRFQNVMNEAFGTNQAETLTRQGLYQSMAENMGIAQEYAYIMSETSAKLVNDLSSLYNKSETTVANALSSGIYSGQVRPMRSFGIDLTEKSLQPILEELDLRNSDGSARTVRNLSQAEKQILRYIAVLKQSGKAHGDWANTIEAPANQLKILSNQAIEASRAFSTLFVGAFGKILPYANAILMVIKEVSNAIATMFGIEISDYNTGIADMGDAFIDVEDDVDGVSNAIKELKKQTLGFDQINNITENQGNGSGTGSSLTGGIDQKLLDSITSYDNGMESVRMKATQIRDQIMKWLGFTKKIDPLTGKVSFKYAGIKTTLKNIWKSFLELNTVGKIFVGLGIATAIHNIWDKSKNLLSIFSGKNGLTKTTGLLFDAFKDMLSPLGALPSFLDDINFSNTNLIDGLIEQVDNWSNCLTSAEKFKLELVGAGGLVVSLGLLHDGMESISEDGVNFANVLETMTGALGSVASGALMGGTIGGGTGAIVGGIVGGILGLVTALQGYKTESQIYLEQLEKETEAIKKETDEYLAQHEAIEKKAQEQLNTEVIYYENLITELDSLIDANDNVKAGYEDRVNFILGQLNDAYGTEMSLIDGKISKYNDEKKKILELIEQRKTQIVLEGKQKNYLLALENQSQQTSELIDKRKEYNNAQEKHNELLKKYDVILFDNSKSIYEKQVELEKLNREISESSGELDKLGNQVENLEKDVAKNSKSIIDYTNLETAVVSGNADEMAKAIQQATDSIGGSYQERLERAQEMYNQLIKSAQENDGVITEVEKATAEAQLNTVIKSLKDQTEVVNGELSDDLLEAWEWLATNSKDRCVNAISDLPGDIKNNLSGQFASSGTELGSILGKSISDNLKINGNTLNSTWNSAISKLQEKLSKTNTMLGGTLLSPTQLKINGYADGGIPPIGQMFIAREKGPELVGSIGKKTAVMNNNQIVDSVKAGVYEAVSMALTNNTSSTNVDINVHAEEGIIVEKAVRGIQQHVNKTGELPFTVPM